MLKIFMADEISVEEILSRKSQNEKIEKIEKTVSEIIKNVCENRDKALFEYTEKFDGVKLNSLKVTQAEIEKAYLETDKYFIETLLAAKKNIELFHSKQIRKDFLINGEKGIKLGQKFLPIEKVGLYIPGGTASYPSTVLMNAIPAILAGVKKIIMVTPPDKNGNVSDCILASAKIAGISDIYKIGGAQAVAALAYGTESIPKVDKIVGPGNIFVATAKKQVFGLVSIDMIAGPSEILIIADKNANPVYVAADMLSQAEHDIMASSILITDSIELAFKVQNEVEKMLKELPREPIARISIYNNGKIIVTKSIDDGIKISNAIAPEHLEIITQNSFDYLDKIKNAGSIFLGENTPEALGDYFAGPNHTLPTSGTARFSSPLSVDDFVKKSSYIYYTNEALSDVKNRVCDFALREGLQAHANSVAVRFKEQNYE